MTTTIPIHYLFNKVYDNELAKTLYLQSADVTDLPVDSGETNAQVMTFIDNSTGAIHESDYVTNPIASASATQNTDLGEFLSRPTPLILVVGQQLQLEDILVQQLNLGTSISIIRLLRINYRTTHFCVLSCA